MKKLAFLLFFFSFNCQSYSQKDCEDLDREKCDVLQNFTVFGQNNTIHFNHLCSELGHNKNYYSSYAFFENTIANANYKALALAKVNLGWPYGLSGFKGISLSLKKLKLEFLQNWANDFFSIGIKLQNLNTKQEFTGVFSKAFAISKTNNQKKYSYQISSKGNFELEDLFKAEQPKKGKVYKRNAEFIRISEEKIAHSLKDRYQLYLIIKNTAKNSIIRLRGPVLQNLTNSFDIEEPKLKVRKISEAFSAWKSWRNHGNRYHRCIYLGRQAKKDFNNRFSNL